MDTGAWRGLQSMGAAQGRTRLRRLSPAQHTHHSDPTHPTAPGCIRGFFVAAVWKPHLKMRETLFLGVAAYEITPSSDPIPSPHGLLLYNLSIKAA